MIRFLGVLALVFLQVPAFSQTPTSLEGTVVAVVLDHLQVRSSSGATQVVVLPPGALVTRRTAVPWTDIREGDWVGVDSKPGADGGQVSVAINVFSPKLIERVRKGQFTMASGDLMTNAPVEKVSTGKDGDSLVLRSEGAMVPIRIGSGTVVHRLLDASSADLRPGAKVQVRGTEQDGTLQALSVNIES